MRLQILANTCQRFPFSLHSRRLVGGALRGEQRPEFRRVDCSLRLPDDYIFLQSRNFLASEFGRRGFYRQ